MTVLREIQTRARVLLLYENPPTIINTALNKAAEQEHKPVSVLKKYLVLQCLHSLRAIMPHVVPITLDEQEIIMTEIRSMGKVSLIPASFSQGFPNAPMSKFAARSIEIWDNPQGKPVAPPASVPVNTQIQQYSYWDDHNVAEDEYCIRAKAFGINRTSLRIGDKRQDDWWPYMNGPNATVPLRR